MNFSNSRLYDHLNEKKAVKVIAGLNNTNISEIAKIAQAAELADASYIDVCANTKVVKFLRSMSRLPICISSLEPLDIYNCVVAGADIVEVGNYDSFYERGTYISSDDIIKLVKEIKNLINDTLICVTVPYYLSLDEQIDLAYKLESIGIDILQTEGLYFNSYSKCLFNNDKNFSQIDCSNTLSTSLLSTYVIAQNVKLPVITASGLTDVFAACTNFYGSSGVGIGSAIRKRKSVLEMVKYISQVKNSLINSREHMSVYLAHN